MVQYAEILEAVSINIQDKLETAGKSQMVKNYVNWMPYLSVYIIILRLESVGNFTIGVKKSGFKYNCFGLV